MHIDTTQSFVESMSKKHPSIVLLEPYVNASTKIHYQCNVCGYDYYNQPRSLIKNGCPYCNHIPRHFLAQKEYEALLLQKTNGQYLVIDKYQGMNVKIKHHCVKHNYDWFITPAKIIDRSQGCFLCAKEKIAQHADTRRSSLESVKSAIEKKYGQEFELLDSNYINNHTKMSFMHHLSDGTCHHFMSTTNALLRGEGCGVCRNSQICVGVNDLCTTHPSITQWLLNPSDGQKYTYGSNKRLDWVCPDCGSIISQKPISDIVQKGFVCNCCSDGISYPNKFIFNTLQFFHKDIEVLKTEYHPKWLQYQIDNITKTGRYDIYFKLKNNNQKYIVEMDGGLGHGYKTFGTNSDDQLRQLHLQIDAKKQELAEAKGYHVIRIDCNYKNLQNRYSYIKTNLLKSELSKLFDFSQVDFDVVDKVSQTSQLVQCCELYNQGHSFRDIQVRLNIKAQSTIQKYLLVGNKIGLCRYVPGSEFKKVHSHPVICLTTNQVFTSIREAANYYHLNVSTISCNCRKLREYGGKDQAGNKLYWQYMT